MDWLSEFNLCSTDDHHKESQVEVRSDFAIPVAQHQGHTPAFSTQQEVEHELNHGGQQSVPKALDHVAREFVASFDNPPGARAGSLVGVGCFFEKKDGHPATVKRVLPGGSADRFGNVRPGDILLSVNDNDVHDLRIREIGNLVLGRHGTTCKLVLQSSGLDIANGRMAGDRYQVFLVREGLSAIGHGYAHNHHHHDEGHDHHSRNKNNAGYDLHW